MFGKKAAVKKLDYNPAEQKPVLKCSICNGEQVAGLKNIKTGKVEEVMVIRGEKDLETFKRMCGVTDVVKEY